MPKTKPDPRAGIQVTSGGFRFKIAPDDLFPPPDVMQGLDYAKVGARLLWLEAQRRAQVNGLLESGQSLPTGTRLSQGPPVCAEDVLSSRVCVCVEWPKVI